MLLLSTLSLELEGLVCLKLSHTFIRIFPWRLDPCALSLSVIFAVSEVDLLAKSPLLCLFTRAVAVFNCLHSFNGFLLEVNVEVNLCKDVVLCINQG